MPEACTPMILTTQLPTAQIDQTDDYCDPESASYDAILMETGEPITMENAEDELITMEHPNATEN